MGQVWLASALWMGLALAASILSVWTNLSVALIEVFVGILAGNMIGLAATPWVDYLAGLGAIMLAFLAGIEIRWTIARKHARVSLAIGSGAFIAPFLGVFLLTFLLLKWTWLQAVIAAIALSTTSVALVFAVIIEAGLNRTEVGQIVLAARFVNDIGTVLAFSIVAADFDYRLAAFAAAMSAALWIIPKMAPWFLEKMERTVSEPDIRFVAVILFLLGGLGSISGIEAVVPAYIIGVALAPTLERHDELTSRLRTVAFAWFTLFYFLRAGSFVDMGKLAAAAATAAALLVVKIVCKCGAIIPLTREFLIGARNGWAIALLMSTGLTFGTITAFFGLTHGIIDRQQYAILVASVIASGTIPILIAQRSFNQTPP